MKEDLKKVVQLLGYLKPYWPWSTLVAFLAVLSLLLVLILPLFMQVIIDGVFSETKEVAISRVISTTFRHSFLGVPESKEAVGELEEAGVPKGPQPSVADTKRGKMRVLLILVLVAVTLTIIEKILFITYNKINDNIGQQIVLDLRFQIFNHFQSMSMHEYTRTPTGAVMSTIINDIPNLRNFVTNSILFLFTNLIHLIVVTTILAIWSWKLLALCLFTFPAFVVINRVMGKHIGHLAALRLQMISETFSLLQDQVSNLRITKAFLNKVFEGKRFSSKFGELKSILHRSFMVGVFTQQSIGFISFLGPMIVLLYGGYNVIYGLMTVGQLIAFHTYLGQLYGPLGSIINLNLEMRGALIVYDKLLFFLATPEEPDPEWHVEDFEFNEVISFEKVYFEYEPDQPIFESLDLVIPKGSCAAIVGPSGYGKTTILNLLYRYYDPWKGDIWIDDVNLKHIHPRYLRRKIGVLEQKPELFVMNISDNIRYGRLEATDEELIEAAKRAGAHDFIMELPDGYDTMVSEGGANLSGGQRQRLAIARLIIKNPPIILLDEPTVGLDVDVKEHLFEYILEMNHRQEATIIVVTHDLEDVDKLCNHITIIDKGRVIYSGDIGRIRERFHRKASLTFDVRVESEWTEIQLRDLTEKGLSFELNIPPEAIRVTHKEGSSIGIEVDREAATPASVVAYMVERFGILDLYVSHATIESIIRDIYAGRISVEGVAETPQPGPTSPDGSVEEMPL